MELKHDDRLITEQMNDAELDMVQGATLRSCFHIEKVIK